MLVIFGSLYFTFAQDVTKQKLFLGLGQNQTVQKKLKIDNTVINIEVAESVILRKQGLGGRDSLPEDSGMLFVFSKPGKYQFWMKGMKFKLDFIFINDGKIVDMLSNIPNPAPDQKDDSLPVYQPVVPVKMVLEVSAGFIDKHNLKIGSSIDLSE